MVGLNHLKESAFKEFFKLLSEWLFIFLKNKYDVGITREEYVICLNDDTPVKSYTPRNSPAVKKAIKTDLEKLERADLIQTSISPYLAPTVCIKKPDGSLRLYIEFKMVNKNVINDAYPMH